MSTQPPLHRRFLPVRLETTSPSHRQPGGPLTPPESILGLDAANDDKENPSLDAVKIQSIQEPTPPAITQLPKPIETTRSSHRILSTIQSEDTPESKDSTPSTPPNCNEEEVTWAQDDASTPRRRRSAMAQPPQSPTTTHLTPLKLTSSPRFKPQLIETTRRSRRASQPYAGPIAELASPSPSDREVIASTPIIRKEVVPHHKLTIWMPPDYSQALAPRPKRPPPRPLDGRSDLLTPHESRSSSLPPPLAPYRQGSMRPHFNTRENTSAGNHTDSSTPTGDTPQIFIRGFGGDKQLFSAGDQWSATPTPSTSASDRPRDSSYSSTPSLSGSFDSSLQSQADFHCIRELSTSQHLARTRESCDERYSGYLLSLAAIAAEQQLKEKSLKEQVESSFPNRDFCYEPVSHWGPGDEDSEESRANTKSSKDFTDGADDEIDVADIDSDDESDDGFEGPPELPHEMLGRKESAQAKHVVDLGNGMLLGIPEPLPSPPTEAGMTMEEILAHEEKLVRQRAESTFRKVAEEASAPSFKDPFWTNGTSKTKALDGKALKELRGEGKKREEELRVMRDAATPPMLGEDLVFRMCPSPQRTKCETDQRHKVQVPKATNGGGLWGGYCVSDGKGDRTDQVRRGPQLLETPGTQTPLDELEDSAESSVGYSFLPLTEGSSSSDSSKGKRSTHSRNSSGLRLLNGLDERLQAEVAKVRREEKIREEFDDKFITQVYNYLSLGWPLLAREYDAELSKISGVPIEELRVNDANPDGLGNIGIKTVCWEREKSEEKSLRGTNENSQASSGNDDSGGENVAMRGNARWNALKTYIHEWARQHPDLDEEGKTEWGDETSRRKGSWAI